MLVTLKEMMDICEERKCAVGAFNTPNLESALAAIRAAEELKLPVILQHAEVHEEYISLDVIGPVMLDFAKKAAVPVCVHLDHGESMDLIYKALDMGFTSVMYDGSVLSYEENLENTKKVVAYAKMKGASVEAELGCMGKRENGDGSAEDDRNKIYTDPDQAACFVEATGIDALACSFGTTHGVYLTEPKLDFSVVEQVRAKAGIPVVMHGGSGVSAEDFRKAIEKGVRKINYYTYMAIAGGEAVAEFVEKNKYDKTPLQMHDIAVVSMNAMKENCKEAMRIFSMK